MSIFSWFRPAKDAPSEPDPEAAIFATAGIDTGIPGIINRGRSVGVMSCAVYTLAATSEAHLEAQRREWAGTGTTAVIPTIRTSIAAADDDSDLIVPAIMYGAMLVSATSDASSGDSGSSDSGSSGSSE